MSACSAARLTQDSNCSVEAGNVHVYKTACSLLQHAAAAAVAWEYKASTYNIQQQQQQLVVIPLILIVVHTVWWDSQGTVTKILGFSNSS